MTVAEASRRLYHSPRGLFPHQVDGVVQVVVQPGLLVVWDTGTGKTHLAMASSALLFEDDAIDLVIVACEKEKLNEWVADFKEFTDLTVLKYHGLPLRAKTDRGKSRTKTWSDPPQVIVSTYETLRNDCAYEGRVKVGKKTVKRWLPGPMTEALMRTEDPLADGRRVMVVYDEVTKIGASRTSGLYKGHEAMLNAFRPHGLKVIGLSATPMERNPENFFNLGRILFPHRMPTVKDFEARYVKTTDIFGNHIAFKNLTADTCEPGVPPLRSLYEPVMLRKSKNDPDIRDFFPKVTEQFAHIALDSRHQEFYETVADVFADADEWTQRSLFTIMRMIAGHPLSLLTSKSQVAQTIVREVGEAGLKALGAAKCDNLIQRLIPIVKGQGAQAIVFTFFGPSMGPHIQRSLEEAGITVAPFYGPGGKAKEDAKMAFRAGEYEVLLSSDAGSKGLNIPEATYIENYELPLTHSNYVQRYSRAVRLGDPGQPPVTVRSMIVVHTAEDGVEKLGWRRAEWNDQLLGDEDTGEDLIDAKTRKKLMQISRKVTVEAA